MSRSDGYFDIEDLIQDAEQQNQNNDDSFGYHDHVSQDEFHFVHIMNWFQNTVAQMDGDNKENIFLFANT